MHDAWTGRQGADPGSSLDPVLRAHLRLLHRRPPRAAFTGGSRRGQHLLRDRLPPHRHHVAPLRGLHREAVRRSRRRRGLQDPAWQRHPDAGAGPGLTASSPVPGARFSSPALPSPDDSKFATPSPGRGPGRRGPLPRAAAPHRRRPRDQRLRRSGRLLHRRRRVRGRGVGAHRREKGHRRLARALDGGLDGLEVPGGVHRHRRRRRRGEVDPDHPRHPGRRHALHPVGLLPAALRWRGEVLVRRGQLQHGACPGGRDRQRVGTDRAHERSPQHPDRNWALPDA